MSTLHVTLRLEPPPMGELLAWRMAWTARAPKDEVPLAFAALALCLGHRPTSTLMSLGQTSGVEFARRVEPVALGAACALAVALLETYAPNEEAAAPLPTSPPDVALRRLYIAASAPTATEADRRVYLEALAAHGS